MHLTSSRDGTTIFQLVQDFEMKGVEIDYGIKFPLCSRVDVTQLNGSAALEFHVEELPESRGRKPRGVHVVSVVVGSRCVIVGVEEDTVYCLGTLAGYEG